MRPPLINQYFITEPGPILRIKSTKLNEIAEKILETNVSHSTKTDKILNSKLKITLKRSPSRLNTSSTIMVEANGLGKSNKSIQTPRNSPTVSRTNSLIDFRQQSQIATPNNQLKIQNSIKKSPGLIETNTTNEIFKPKLPNFNIRTSSKRNTSVYNNFADYRAPSKLRYYHSSILGRILTIKNENQNKDNLKRSANGVMVYNLVPTLLPKRNKIPSRKNNNSQELIEDPNGGQLYRPYSKCSLSDDDQELIYSSLLEQPNSSYFYKEKSNVFLTSTSEIPKLKETVLIEPFKSISRKKSLRAADVVKSNIPNYLDIYRFL